MDSINIRHINIVKLAERIDRLNETAGYSIPQVEQIGVRHSEDTVHVVFTTSDNYGLAIWRSRNNRKVSVLKDRNLSHIQLRNSWGSQSLQFGVLNKYVWLRCSPLWSRRHRSEWRGPVLNLLFTGGPLWAGLNDLLPRKEAPKGKGWGREITLIIEGTCI